MGVVVTIGEGEDGHQLGADGEEKSHVASVEALYQMNERLELGGKLAGKLGSVRLRSDGDWYDSRLGFAAVLVAETALLTALMELEQLIA